MDFNFHDSIEGCPKEYNGSSPICEECFRKGDCKIELIEGLATDPKKHAKAAFEISKEVLKLMEEEQAKKWKETSPPSPGIISMGHGIMQPPDFDNPAAMDRFFKFLVIFQAAASRNGFPCETEAELKLFLDLYLRNLWMFLFGKGEDDEKEGE